MKHLVTLAIILTLVAPVAASEAPPMLQVVPDHVAFAVYTADSPELIESWNKTPLAQMWSDSEISEFFAPLRAEMEVDRWNEMTLEETGYEIEELIDFLTGECVFYVPATDDLFDISPEDDDFPLVFFADVGERAEELASLILRQEEKADEESEAENPTIREIRDFRGIELHIVKSETEDGFNERGTWALIGERIGFASNPELLQDLIIATQDDEHDQVLSDSSNFVEAMNLSGDSEIVGFADLEIIMSRLKAKAMEEAEQSGSPQMVTPDALFTALGLDTWRAGFMALDLESRYVDMSMGISYTDDQGLMRILAYSPGGVPRSPLVPANATTFGGTRIDFQKSWAAIEEIMNTLNPAFQGLLSSQLTAMAEGAGVELDLRTDILDNLGQEIISVQTPVATASADDAQQLPTPSQAIAIQITQREAFESGIEKLKTIFSSGSEFFEKRDYLGTAIYTFKQDDPASTEAPPMQQGFSYAITDEYAVIGIGDSAALEAVLVSMQKPGKSGWDRPEVKQALAMIPPGPQALEYQDLVVASHTVFKTFAALESTTSNDDGNWVDPDALPSKDAIAKYIGNGVTALYKDADSLVVHVRVSPPLNAIQADHE